jgi:DHA3 family tetracycline resistance protein-like MFS transporter
MFAKRDAYHVYLLMEGSLALFVGLIFTVNMVYQATTVGLNPLQLVLVGTTLELVVFVFEVPTGIVADVYSRRLSILIGVLLVGFGFALEGLFPIFGVVLLAQVFWGLGATFTSGASQAWIADEVGEERAGKAFLRASQAGMIGGLIAIPLSVALASVSIQLPIVLGGVLTMIMAGVLALIMPENGFRPTPPGERTTWGALSDTLRSGLRLVRGRTMLLIFLGVAAISGLYSEGFDRLWTAHLLEDYRFPTLGDLEPVVWFGVIRAVSIVLSISATEVVRRQVGTSHQGRIAHALIGLTVLTVVGILAFALAESFALALIAYWLVSVARTVTEPLVAAWTNLHAESSVRATIFSLTNQVNAIGQIAGGPGVGYIGKVRSLRAALVVSGLMLSPAVLLFARGLRESRDVPVVPATAAAPAAD